jgi:ribose transport system substrate-binding protein
MNRRRYLGALCALSLAGAALSGCVQNTTAPTTAGNAPGTPGNAPSSASTPTIKTKGENEKLTLALVPKGTTHEFWQTVKAGAEAAGKENNAEILFNGPSEENNVQEQIDILRNYGTQGVDGVAVAATDKQSVAGPVDDLQAKGIPVVVVDSSVEPDHSFSFIATDNVAAARLAAEEMGRLLNGKGKVAVLNFKKGSGTSDEREQGFMEGIKKFPGIEVVAQDDTESQVANAVDKTQTMVTAHPDLDGIFASNEPNVIGAAKVLKDKGLAGKVKLVGFDGAKAEIEGLEAGTVQALILQDPFKMGFEGVKALCQVLRGKGKPEKRIDTGAKVVTKENMNTPEMQKILYPLGKK